MIQVSQFKNVVELLEYFKDEETCKNYLEKKRWGDNPSCPECGNTKIYRTDRGFRCSIRKCGTKFSVKVGTVMENSNIKLKYWFAAIYLISAHKKGISSCQLARDLGVTQKTAWFMNHRIRKAMKDNDTSKLSGVVEADETYVGGKNKNRHKNKKVDYAQGRSTVDKSAVVGFKERGGKIITMHVDSTGAKAMQPLLEEYIEQGTQLMTDEWSGYAHAHRRFDHKSVNHSAKRYVDGIVHTNGVENYWSLLKRSINGIYHWVSYKHLHKYCDEMAYRYNSRKQSDCERFDAILTHVEGRVKYHDLIYNPPMQEPVVEEPQPEKTWPPVIEQNEDGEIEFKSMREYLKYKDRLKKDKKNQKKREKYKMDNPKSTEDDGQ